MGQGYPRNLVGLVVKLYDRDDNYGDDEDGVNDYIGSYFLNYTADGNYGCLEFPWYTGGDEIFPDPYIISDWSIIDTEFPDANKKGAIFHDTWTPDEPCTGPKRYVSWRNLFYRDLGANGTTAVSVSMAFGDVANKIAMQMNALQKFFRSFRSWHMTDNLHVQWEDDALSGNITTPNSTCIKAAAIIHVDIDGDGTPEPMDNYKRWDGIVHEAGHAYHMQLLRRNSLPTGDYCGHPHFGYCANSEYCATTEGWAEFVSVFTWWPDNRDQATPYIATGVNTYDIEPGAFAFRDDKGPGHADCGGYRCTILNCACYSHNEIMAARAFWDIWDMYVDNLDDWNTNQSAYNIARLWTLFPDGSQNGGRDEENMNMLDYQRNATRISSDFYSDVVRVFQWGQTCMYAQDDT